LIQVQCPAAQYASIVPITPQKPEGAGATLAVSVDLVLRLRFEHRLELPIDEVGRAESRAGALRLQCRGAAVFVLGASIVLSGDGA